VRRAGCKAARVGLEFLHPATLSARIWLSLFLCAAAVAVRYLIVAVVRLATHRNRNERLVFWTRQGVALGVAVLALLGLVAIWIEDAGRLAMVGGLIGAGVAFALQKVITAFAGYLVILRGRTFTVGDRITMGGVRGDVVSLGFLQTRILEMGEPPAAQSSDNSAWVHARQYTGRIVTVTNDKLFDQPVYNFTREFPFMWEEIHIPVPYKSDRVRAEAIVIDCARKVTEQFVAASESARRRLEHRYFVDIGSVGPRVFYNLTDNWIEMNVRFITEVHGVRYVKDELQRMILDRFEEAGIEIASATFVITGLPRLDVQVQAPAAVDQSAATSSRR